MDQTSVRYIVDDLDEVIDFYSANLDFEEVMRAGSGSPCCAAGRFACC